jgi:hypothetical protein
MHTVPSELVVCGINPDVSSTSQEDSAENGSDHVFNMEDIVPTGAFTLGPLADASIALRREGSALEIADEDESNVSVRSTPRERRHALDESSETTVKALLVLPANTRSSSPAQIKASQSIDTRIPHGPANQPTTSALLKTIPSSIRNRAKSLHEPHPLPFRWKLPQGQRFRIGDPEAFTALQQKNIEWYVTTGLLLEDYTGLRWNAGTYRFLLYWHVEGMPTPDGIEDKGRKYLRIEPEFMRDWQKEKWQREFGDGVLDVEDEPATPIIQLDTLADPPSPFKQVSSRPLTPSRERNLPPWSKSALRSQSRPASPTLSIRSDPGPPREKKVRLQSRKCKRIVELEVDDDGVAIVEQGKIVERNVDEVGVLSDNEGRTARNWLGVN